MKVFLDTNIIFSAILFPNSVPDRALQKALSYPNIAITSNYCLEELERKFKQKFPGKVEKLNDFLKIFVLCIKVVDASDKMNELEKKIRDLKDRPVLRAAIENKADIIITGDKDLLDSGIVIPKIITASDFYNNY